VGRNMLAVIINADSACYHLYVQLIHAFQITFDNTMERQPLSAPSNVEFVNMADTSVRRLVKMAKNLTHFQKLDQQDQILLLKGAIVEVLVLRSSKMFNSESMSWQVCCCPFMTRAGVGKLFGVEGRMDPPTNLLQSGQVNFT